MNVKAAKGKMFVVEAEVRLNQSDAWYGVVLHMTLISIPTINEGPSATNCLIQPSIL